MLNIKCERKNGFPKLQQQGLLIMCSKRRYWIIQYIHVNNISSHTFQFEWQTIHSSFSHTINSSTLLPYHTDTIKRQDLTASSCVLWPHIPFFLVFFLPVNFYSPSFWCLSFGSYFLGCILLFEYKESRDINLSQNI